MVVLGDATEGAGLHNVTVHAVNGDKVQVTRKAWTDEDLLHDAYDPQNKAKRQFREITVADNLLLNANETPTKESEKVLKKFDKKDLKKGDPLGEGSGIAILYRKDKDFSTNSPEGVDDMVMMTQLNDAELANNLKVKFKSNMGYVRCGPTLVALNLMANYKTTAYPTGCFGDDNTCNDLMTRFQNMKDRDSENPHVWALASHCFKQAFAPLTATHKTFNQAMIITGESGAGKTYNTKKILAFLAHVGGGEAEKKKTDKMLSTTPILEGFGNANMPRNPDSSRFGKLYKIYFKPDQKLSGCMITPYMLEKSRVSQQQMNERNFHIFYRMLAPPKPIEDHKDVNPKDPGTGQPLESVDAAKIASESEKLLKREMTYYPDGDTNGPGEPQYWEAGGKKMIGLHPDKRAMCRLGVFEDYVYLNGGTNMVEMNPMCAEGQTPQGEQYKRIYGDIPKDWVPKDQVETICPGGPRIYEDAGNMCETMVALLGFFDKDTVDTILKVAAGVLHLGNIEFEGDEDTLEGLKSNAITTAGLKNAAELWGVEESKLVDACTKRTVATGGGQMKQFPAQNLGQAINFRDTIARMVYDRLFMWIIDQSSKQLFQGARESETFIGVLDIFGFEFYENHQIKAKNMQVVNGLDQLNINICNELLQQQFVQVIFGLETEGYKAQNVDFSFDNFEDNKKACNFLTASSGPLLKALEKPSNMRKTDKAGDFEFITELKKLAKSMDAKEYGGVDGALKGKRENATAVYLEYGSKLGRSAFNGLDGGPYGKREVDGKVIDEVGAVSDSMSCGGHTAGGCPAFGIRHYAAEVSYDMRGWCEKDKDNPTDEMALCLSGSSDKTFMSPVFSAPPGTGKAGVTAAFCNSLNTLLTTLGQTDMNFVRCLKASNPLAKGIFQSALVLKQLKYTGMLDTLKIRTFGFPSRMGYQEFVDWAKILCPNVDITQAVAAAAGDMVAHLQTTYAEEIFAQLPASDQITKVDQKKQTVVQGKPSDTTKNIPVVMMRDWFFRGLDKRRGELLKEFTDVAKAAVGAAVHKDLFFGKKSAGIRLMGPMLKAMCTRQKYYQAKFKYIPMKSRTKLVLLIRAQLKRKEYTTQRGKHFEGFNRQLAQSWIYATVQRQEFYEKKKRFADKMIRDIECAKLQKQQDFAEALNRERAEQEAARQAEAEQMAAEQAYARDLITAKQQALIDKAKQYEANICEEQYSLARVEIAKVESSSDKLDELDHVFDNTTGKMLMNHMKQVLAQIETQWQQKHFPNNPPVKRVEWQEGGGHRDQVDKLHASLPRCPKEIDYAENKAYVRAWREYLYGELAAIEMEALDGYQEQANREMETLMQAEAPVERHNEHLDHAHATGAASTEGDVSLTTVDKEYLRVNLDCNIRPDEINMPGPVRAAVQRAISSLIKCDTMKVNISI